jgi:hypothetical protein
MLAAAVFLFLRANKGYTPPAFDSSAQPGVPVPDAGFYYDTLSSDFGYQFSFAANLYQQEDRSVKVYFTNPAENSVNLMCEITSDATGKVLYRSGVIRPGEYVESLSPKGRFANEKMDITLTVYAFEKDTWHSAGSSTVSTVLQPW